jgi:hypothetical protein
MIGNMQMLAKMHDFKQIVIKVFKFPNKTKDFDEILSKDFIEL